MIMSFRKNNARNTNHNLLLQKHSMDSLRREKTSAKFSVNILKYQIDYSYK